MSTASNKKAALITGVTGQDRACLAEFLLDMGYDVQGLGFECRPIVADNFAKNEVVNYFNHEVLGQLRNAQYIDDNGLFVGNHQYPIDDAIDGLSRL